MLAIVNLKSHTKPNSFTILISWWNCFKQTQYCHALLFYKAVIALFWKAVRARRGFPISFVHVLAYGMSRVYCLYSNKIRNSLVSFYVNKQHCNMFQFLPPTPCLITNTCRHPRWPNYKQNGVKVILVYRVLIQFL